MHSPFVRKRSIDNARAQNEKIRPWSRGRFKQPAFHFGFAASILAGRSRGGILVNIPGLITVDGDRAELDEFSHSCGLASGVETKRKFRFSLWRWHRYVHDDISASD